MEKIKPRKILNLIKDYHKSREALVITGFRRVGKTTILKSIYTSIGSANKLFLDLETPVNQKLFAEENYDNIILALQGRGINFDAKVFLFLDEIQFVKNLPSIVKYLYDHYDIKFYLTGSSSFYLKNFFTESLAGRKYVFNLHPLDFEEFLWFKDNDYRMSSFSAASPNTYYDLFSALYREYLEFGGFPQVVLENNAAEKRIQLNDIIGAYFQLDVQALAHFKENENLKKLLFLLPTRIGSKLDIGKLAESLGVTRITVQNYLVFFQQTFLIDFAKPFSQSRDSEIRKKPKLYFSDTGITSSLDRISFAQLFENKIFNQLVMRASYIDTPSVLQDSVSYYATKYGQEIDFIYSGDTAYEVKQKASMHDVKNLERRAKVLGLAKYRVISLEKTIDSPHIIYPFFLNSKIT